MHSIQKTNGLVWPVDDRALIQTPRLGDDPSLPGCMCRGFFEIR